MSCLRAARSGYHKPYGRMWPIATMGYCFIACIETTSSPHMRRDCFTDGMVAELHSRSDDEMQAENAGSHAECAWAPWRRPDMLDSSEARGEK